jgi:hypothetical protein
LPPDHSVPHAGRLPDTDAVTDSQPIRNRIARAVSHVISQPGNHAYSDTFPDTDTESHSRGDTIQDSVSSANGLSVSFYNPQFNTDSDSDSQSQHHSFANADSIAHTNLRAEHRAGAGGDPVGRLRRRCGG